MFLMSVLVGKGPSSPKHRFSSSASTAKSSIIWPRLGRLLLTNASTSAEEEEPWLGRLQVNEVLQFVLWAQSDDEPFQQLAPHQ